MQGPKTPQQWSDQKTLSLPNATHHALIPIKKAVVLDLATNVGMILVQCSQTPGRIPNLCVNNSFPTRSQASVLEIWCWLTLLDCDSTFWVWFFSFGGASDCTGADIHHFGLGAILLLWRHQWQWLHRCWHSSFWWWLSSLVLGSFTLVVFIIFVAVHLLWWCFVHFDGNHLFGGRFIHFGGPLIGSNHLFVQIIFVWSRSIASMASWGAGSLQGRAAGRWPASPGVQRALG